MALLGFAFGIALLSCGRDVTSPGANVRYARGIAWRTEFPPAYQVAGSAAAGVVDFNRVRVVLHHADGTVALDTVIDYPAGADSILISLSVQLLPSAPSSGEPLSLNLAYINAAGDTVFKGGPVGVTAAPSVPGQPPPPPVTVPVSYTGPGAGAVGVQITPRSGTVVSGNSFNFTAVAVDHNGVAIPNTPIVWNTLDPSIASIPSAASGTAIAGSVRGTARIVAQLLTGPIDQVTLNVLPRATTIALQSGSGQSGIVGSTLANPLVALVTASDGLGVGGVTVTFAVTSGGGSVGSATAVTTDAGLAQSTWQLGNTVGTQDVTASAGTLAGSPVTYTATARSLAPTKLTVTAQPANATAGATLATVTIVAQTAVGDPASAFTGAVTLTLAGGTSGATLGGTTTVNAVGGVATFSNLTVSRSGTSYSLVASSSGLTNATTNSFDIAAGVAGKLVFTSQPSSSTAGVSVGTLAVTATDQFGNTVTGFTGLVTLAIASNPGAATLGGTTSANVIAGVATFGSVTLNRPGSGYTLSASATGLASATSDAFDVAVGAAANIAVVAGAGQSGNVSAALPQPIIVRVQDLGGNGVAGTTVNFAVVTGGGSVLPASGVSNATGLVQTTWTLGATIGAQSMSATSGGLGGSPLTFNATGTSTLLQFTGTTSPAVAQVAGVTVTPGFVVQAQDASNNPISTFIGTVSLAIGTNPGGGTLSGTTSVSAVAGVATFNAFSIDKAGTGYTVVASAAGYTSGVSSAFNIAAGPLATITVTPNPVSLNVNLTQQFTAIGKDASGNVVALTPVWSVAAGGGTISSSGLFVAGTVIGTFANTVTATSGGLSGTATVIVTAASGGVASTTVTTPATKLDTLTSIGDVFTVVATAKNALNNVVAGSYTFLSRNPAVATVNATTGVVTAVTNGSTYVIATEAGGTKDSALFVVQQRVATINVTPGNKNIYLGASFKFTAQAVDGHNNPLVSQPAVVWTSTSPSFATVSASGLDTGLVSGIALGPTQIRATSGAVTGVSSVNIITAIQRIVVARDSAGFSTTSSDTFNMAALLLHRAYKAYAYDTLNALMAGMTFTWASSNPSVAGLDTMQSNRADALSAANGTTSIQATAQGFTGSATLNVAQVLASISLTPASPSIQPTGSVSLTARGKDSNGQFIAGGTFTWTSKYTSIATVNSSGVVTGVATGTDSISANIGAIVSPWDPVIVANSVPASLSFGRDTVSVGRGSSTPVPILLSRPSATTTTLLLTVADTFAYWTSTKVVVPAGQTSINATLNGHNAGNTTITVTDSAGVYAPSTSVLAVQATMRLTSGGYSLNATDQLSTQVLLSDPSPAGGTFVTFSYTTAGVASVSPSPAFIPVGQLAANIVITAVAAGSTNITPVAIGVNGTASSFTTYAPNLTFNNANIRLGQGQYEPSVYVYVPTYTVNAVPLTFTSSDTTVATVTPAGSIPGGSYYFYNTITAKGTGTATISMSSPGWTAVNTVTVQVTTPHVGICCGNNLQTTSPQQPLYIYSEDSVWSTHNRTSSLVVHVSSSDTTVMKVIDTVGTIPPGVYYWNAGHVIPGGAGGTAYIKVTAGGHTSDSTLYTVAGPKLEFSWNSNRLGLGQEDDNAYISVPNNVVSPLVVNLAADTTIVGIPASVTILAGSYYAYFSVRGKAISPNVPIIASAIGYQGDTSYYTVTTPKVRLSGGGTLNNFSGPSGFNVYTADSTLNAHVRTTPLTVTLTSTDTTVFKVDSATATVPAASAYASNMHVTATGVGTAKLIVSAPGHLPDTATYTVQMPQLYVSLGTFTIGSSQQQPGNSFYVSTPDTRATPLTVTLTHNHPSVDSLSSNTQIIAAGTYYQYFSIFALAKGVDTITVSAPGYLPTTAYVRVTTPRLGNSSLPGSVTTTNPPINLNVYAEDSLGSAHYTGSNLVVHAVSSDTTVLKPAAAYFTIPAGQYYTTATVNVIGPGSASITYTDSAGTGYLPTTTNSMTVTGPSLSLSTGSFMLGMRQNTGVSGIYVTTPNNVVTPLVVTLTSTSTRVATTTVSTVTVPAGSYYAYFQVSAQDTIGTIQIQATATGYNATSATLQVTAPKFAISTGTTVNTTSQAQGIVVYAEDANGSTHNTNENVTVTLASSALGVATTDSATVTIVAGTYYSSAAKWIPGLAGTSQLTASDVRAVYYKYTTGSANLTVNTPSLSLNNFNTLGIGQYSDNYFYVSTPDYQPNALTVTLTHPGTARTTVPASVIIGSGSSYAYFRVIGAVAGIDTLVASATSPAHNPATAYTTVGNGRIDPLQGWPGSSMHVGDSVQVTLYARDPNTSGRNVLAATTFTLAPNANIQFVSGGVSSTVITSATIPADGQYVQFYLKAVSSGTGSATITATNYTTYVNTMTVIP